MKISKEEQARRDGMAYALKVAKEKGIDGLEDEIKRRGCSIAPCTISWKELDELKKNISDNAIVSITAMSAYVLRWKFGFGDKRINRFKDCVNDLADSIVRDYLTVDDILEELKNDYGIDLSGRKLKGDD